MFSSFKQEKNASRKFCRYFSFVGYYNETCKQQCWELQSYGCQKQVVGEHSFSTFARFSKKLIFLTQM